MREDVTLLLYAGGNATRMGGCNKALVPFLGTPMVVRVRERLSDSVSAVVLSANRDRAALERLGFTVVEDTFPGRPGPLAGLLAAAERRLIHTRWVLTAPCDAPMVPKNLLSLLWTAAQEDGFTHGAYTIEAEGYPQNAFALIRAERLSEVREYLASGERRLGGWLRTIGQKKVSPTEYDGNFKNLNDFEELEAAETEEKAKNLQEIP